MLQYKSAEPHEGVMGDEPLETRDDAEFDRATLMRSVRCWRCGYDLRGLSLGGRCPECGLEVWQTLAQAVDPASRLLPSVHNPRAVGDALVWLFASLLGAALLHAARPVAQIADRLPGVSASLHVPTGLDAVAGALLLIAVAPALLLRPPRGRAGEAALRRDLWVLAGGLVAAGAGLLVAGLVVGGGVPSAAAWRSLAWLVAAAGAVAVLEALRRVLRVVGERSRAFRTARGGRQRMRDMTFAMIGMGAGELLRRSARPLAPTHGAAIETVGTVLVWTCTLMVVIGLVYLMVNVWWIRHALRQPPPTIRELVQPMAEASDEGGGTPS